MGFNVWNTVLNHHQEVNSGLYHDLKGAILTSSTDEEYKEKIQDIIY